MKATLNPRLQLRTPYWLRRAEQAYQLLATMSPAATFVSYGLLSGKPFHIPSPDPDPLMPRRDASRSSIQRSDLGLPLSDTHDRHSEEDGLELVATELVAARVLRFIAQPPHDLGGFADVWLAQNRAHRRGHFK
jgi:hypothetical protein